MTNCFTYRYNRIGVLKVKSGIIKEKWIFNRAYRVIRVIRVSSRVIIIRVISIRVITFQFVVFSNTIAMPLLRMSFLDSGNKLF